MEPDIEMKTIPEETKEFETSFSLKNVITNLYKFVLKAEETYEEITIRYDYFQAKRKKEGKHQGVIYKQILNPNDYNLHTKHI